MRNAEWKILIQRQEDDREIRCWGDNETFQISDCGM